MINSSSINLYSVGVSGFRYEYPFNKDSRFSGRMTIPQVRRNFLLTLGETNKKLEGTHRSGLTFSRR